MYRKSEKKVKMIKKIIGIALFTFVLVTNIKISVNDQNSNSDLSLLGLEIEVFDNTYAGTGEPNEKRGLIWCIGTYGSYYVCMPGQSNVVCGGYEQYCV